MKEKLDKMRASGELSPSQENSVRLAMLLAKTKRQHEHALAEAWQAGWDAALKWNGAAMVQNPYRRIDED